MNILSKIDSPEDVRGLDSKLLPQLCGEIREFLIESVSKTGGHLASNLGAVELTVALHRVYDTSRDRIVFDVGHQAYVHKILTGRRDAFSGLRTLGGLSGFPKPCESVHDAFIAGHASNSISVAIGMARARSAAGEDYDVAALIGDGALTGGLSYEGLCNAGASGEPIVVILNDNGMSINSNVGAIARLLANQRVKPGYFSFKRAYRRALGKAPGLYRFFHAIKEWIKGVILPETIFEDLGFYYLGPIDGSDVYAVEAALAWARELREPVLLHVITQKGKGAAFAEKGPDLYHSVSSYDPETGKLPEQKRDFSEAFGEALSELAREDKRIIAITAAMESGTGLSGFAGDFPERFFDVGIAEGHAASMAAGAAKQGLLPVFAVYSSFLQRAYDMLIHDVSLQKLHVVLAVDRAGLVGRDGETHQGVFDVSFLGSVPGMTVYCPSSFKELSDMLRIAVTEETGPVAVRYPRGEEGQYKDTFSGEPAEIIRRGDAITIASYGIMINEAVAAAALLEKQGIRAEVVKLSRILPLEPETVLESAEKTGRLLVAEDACASGCIGEKLLSSASIQGVRLRAARLLNLGEGIVRHGDTGELLRLCGIDGAGIAAAAMEMVDNYEETEARPAGF